MAKTMPQATFLEDVFKYWMEYIFKALLTKNAFWSVISKPSSST
ncbi:MAG: hypothetical protein H6R01_16 [Burkholderiaceae bacterium]|nr:hypothetical protein [Burkholderiaceae bacterium]